VNGSTSREGCRASRQIGLSGSDPFDEDTMLDPHDLEEPGEAQEPATKADQGRRGDEAEEPTMALASRS
jgi:hypothetical protein